MGICGSDILSIPNYCQTNFRNGGISHLIFIKCEDYPFAPEYESDYIAWESFVTNYCVFITNKLRAEKPTTTVSKLKTSFCRPDTIVGMSKTINFVDFNSYEDYFDLKFWDYMLKYDKKYKFGFITCDNLFYGFYDFELEVDVEISDDSKTPERKSGVLNFNGVEVLKGYKVDNLVNLLIENNCI